MKFVQVVNSSRGVELGRRVRVAESLLSRSVGLLGTRDLAAGEGLWLTPCRSVHTLFMRYPIDVIYVDGQNRVLGHETLKPWRMSRWYRQSRGALELAAGTAARTGTAPGDTLEMREGR